MWRKRDNRPGAMTVPVLMTTAQVCEALGVSRATVRRMELAGVLKRITVRGLRQPRYSAAEVSALVGKG